MDSTLGNSIHVAVGSLLCYSSACFGGMSDHTGFLSFRPLHYAFHPKPLAAGDQ